MKNIEKYKDLTPDQVNMFAALTNVWMKVRVTNCILVAFFILLGLLIVLMVWIKSAWQDKAIVGAVEGILGGTMYPLVKHYLPAVQNALKAEKKAKATSVKKIGGATNQN